MGEVVTRWVGPIALFQKWPLLSGSGWRCAWAGGHPCSVSPSLPQPAQQHSDGAASCRPPGLLDLGRVGWIRALYGQERDRGQEETAQEKPFCCVHPALLSPQSALHGELDLWQPDSSLPIWLLSSLSPEMALMRTGRESRLRRGGVLAEAGNHNRKPSVAFAASMRD